MSKKTKLYYQKTPVKVQINEKVYTHTENLLSSMLETDMTYQRPVDLKRVHRINKHFNPGLVNTLKVSHRNGHYYVFDGSHTLALLKLRHGEGVVFEVQCVIFENLTYEEEALLFAEQTGESKDVDFLYKLRAMAVGKNQEVLDFIKHTENAGFKLGLNGKGAGTILALRKAKQVFDKAGAEIYEGTLSLIREAWDTSQEHIQANMLGGMAVFYAAFASELDHSRFVKKLAKAQVDDIRSEAKRRKNKRQSLDGAFAQEIAEMYNSGKGKGSLNLVKISSLGFEGYDE